MYVYAHVHLYVFVYVYVCIDVYAYVYVCANVYVCVCVCTCGDKEGFYEWLERAKRAQPDHEVVDMTGHASIHTAVEAMRHARFRPYTENGIAYKALVDIPFDFVL